MTGAAEIKGTMQELNTLLSSFTLPVIEHLDEASPTLLIALYESLKDVRLPITDRREKSMKARARHFRILLQTVSEDMPSLNLACINLRRLCMGHKRHLCRLIELIIAVGKVMKLNHSAVIDAEISAAQDNSAASTNPATSTSLSDTGSASESSECVEGSVAASDNSSTTIEELPINKEVLCSHEALYAESALSNHRTRHRAIALQKRAAYRHSRSLKQCPQTTRKTQNLHTLPKGRDPSKACGRPGNWPESPSTPRQQVCTRSILKAENCPFEQPDDHHKAACDTNEGRHSFLSDSCYQITPTAHPSVIVVDSPYTKYLKARRELLMTGNHHHVSPLRPSPGQKHRPASRRTKWSALPARSVFQSEKSPLARCTLHSHTRRSPLRQKRPPYSLLSSVGSSTNSDQSLYGDELMDAMY